MRSEKLSEMKTLRTKSLILENLSPCWPWPLSCCCSSVGFSLGMYKIERNSTSPSALKWVLEKCPG